MSTRTTIALAALLAAFHAPAAPANEQAFVRRVDDKQLKWSPCPEFIPRGCKIAVLDGDPAQPHAAVFFKVPAGFEIPDHRHTSAERMVLVSGRMTVTYEGQRPVTLTPGMYAYGPPGKPHAATCADGDPCVLFIAFIEPLDAFPVK